MTHHTIARVQLHAAVHCSTEGRCRRILTLLMQLRFHTGDRNLQGTDREGEPVCHFQWHAVVDARKQQTRPTGDGSTHALPHTTQLKSASHEMAAHSLFPHTTLLTPPSHVGKPHDKQVLRHLLALRGREGGCLRRWLSRATCLPGTLSAAVHHSRELYLRWSA